MHNFFLRPYPLEDRDRWSKYALIAGAVVFFFLFFLRPFGLATYPGNIFLVSLYFTAVAFALTLLYGRLVFNPWAKLVKVWRVWHQILAFVLLLCFISVGNSIADSALFGGRVSWMRTLAYLYPTLIIFIPIMLINISLGYQKRLRTRLAEMLPKEEPSKETGQTVTFHDHNVNGTDLTLPVSDFLYAEAQKNFVDVCYRREGRVEHCQLRSTLTSVLADANVPKIFQCHRSFIVNLNNITAAEGNSNGYRLTMGDASCVVPVSRSYVAKLRSFI